MVVRVGAVVVWGRTLAVVVVVVGGLREVDLRRQRSVRRSGVCVEDEGGSIGSAIVVRW